jgi:hypothetical protein
MDLGERMRATGNLAEAAVYATRETLNGNWDWAPILNADDSAQLVRKRSISASEVARTLRYL